MHFLDSAFYGPTLDSAKYSPTPDSAKYSDKLPDLPNSQLFTEVTKQQYTTPPEHELLAAEQVSALRRTPSTEVVPQHTALYPPHHKHFPTQVLQHLRSLSHNPIQQHLFPPQTQAEPPAPQPEGSPLWQPKQEEPQRQPKDDQPKLQASRRRPKRPREDQSEVKSGDETELKREKWRVAQAKRQSKLKSYETENRQLKAELEDARKSFAAQLAALRKENADLKAALHSPSH